MRRSFTMLETGKSFLFPRCIQFYKSCSKLVSQLCAGSQDETLSIRPPEGHVPSCHIGLQHSSFCAPRASGLQLILHLLLTISRTVHVGWGLTVFTQDTKVHCVHLSWLFLPMSLPSCPEIPVSDKEDDLPLLIHFYCP